MSVLKTMVDVNMTVSTSLVPLNVSKPFIIVYFMCNNTFCLQVLVQLDTLQMTLIVLMRMNVWPTMDMVLVRILAPIQKEVFIVHVKVCQGPDWHQIKRLVKKLISVNKTMVDVAMIVTPVMAK